MAVPRRSGSEARRQLVMSGVLVALLAALLLVGADSQRVVIAQWIAADPSSSLARMRGVLIGLALVGVSPLLVYAAALWRLAGGHGSRAALPPDAKAQRQTRHVAVLLLAIACVILLCLWWLAESVTPATP